MKEKKRDQKVIRIQRNKLTNNGRKKERVN